MELQQTAMPPYPWQHNIWAKLCETVASGTLPHALLINGPEGVGVESLSQAVARYLLCQSPLEDVACGRCRSCTLLNSGMHPDLLLISLEEDASQIKVDQIRRCVEFDAKTAHFDNYKVVLISSAEAMNANAANALLKNLEEPLGKTRFLLSCEHVDSLLPTIRSRCQKISVPLPDRERALDWLANETDNNIELEAWLIRFGGAPLGVKKAIDSGLVENLSKFSQSINGLFEHRSGAMAMAKDWKNTDIDGLFSLQFWVLEELVKSRTLKNQLSSDLHVLQGLVGAIDVKRMFLFRDKLLNRLSQWRSQSNPNTALMIEEMALDWQALLRAS